MDRSKEEEVGGRTAWGRARGGNWAAPPLPLGAQPAPAPYDPRGQRTKPGDCGAELGRGPRPGGWQAALGDGKAWRRGPSPVRLNCRPTRKCS